MEYQEIEKAYNSIVGKLELYGLIDSTKINSLNEFKKEIINDFYDDFYDWDQLPLRTLLFTILGNTQLVYRADSNSCMIPPDYAKLIKEILILKGIKGPFLYNLKERENTAPSRRPDYTIEISYNGIEYRHNAEGGKYYDTYAVQDLINLIIENNKLGNKFHSLATEDTSFIFFSGSMSKLNQVTKELGLDIEEDIRIAISRRRFENKQANIRRIEEELIKRNEEERKRKIESDALNRINKYIVEENFQKLRKEFEDNPFYSEEIKCKILEGLNPSLSRRTTKLMVKAIENGSNQSSKLAFKLVRKKFRKSDSELSRIITNLLSKSTSPPIIDLCFELLSELYSRSLLPKNDLLIEKMRLVSSVNYRFKDGSAIGIVLLLNFTKKLIPKLEDLLKAKNIYIAESISIYLGQVLTFGWYDKPFYWKRLVLEIIDHTKNGTNVFYPFISLVEEYLAYYKDKELFFLLLNHAEDNQTKYRLRALNAYMNRVAYIPEIEDRYLGYLKQEVYLKPVIAALSLSSNQSVKNILYNLKKIKDKNEPNLFKITSRKEYMNLHLKRLKLGRELKSKKLGFWNKLKSKFE